MAGMESFLTGFLNTTAETIGKRKDEADAYFQEQMETARQVGLQSRQKMQQQMDQGINQARQLQQVGVPQDVVIAIAQQNPADIPVFLDQIQKLKERGVNVDADFVRNLVEVTGEVSPGESIEQAFARIYTPLSEIPAEDINNDPAGSIWATMMGHNAMDRARGKLADTEILPGLSAQQALDYSNFTPNTGGSTVTLNASLAGQALRDAAKAQQEPDELSVASLSTLANEFDAEYDALRKEHEETTGIPYLEDPTFNEAELRAEAVRRLEETYGPENVQAVPYIAKWTAGTQESVDENGAPPETLSEAPQSPEMGAEAPTLPETADGALAALSGSPELEGPPAPQAPAPEPVPTVATPEGDMPGKLPGGEEYVGPSGRPGVSVYRLPDGREVRVKNEDAKLWARQISGWTPVGLSAEPEFDMMKNEFDPKR